MTKIAVGLVAVVAVAVLSSSMPAAHAQQQQQQPPRSAPSPPAERTPRQNRSVTVRDAGTLRAALDDGSVSEILLADAGRDIDLAGAEASFPIGGPPAVIGPGRTLVVRSSDGAFPASLNFTGGPTPAIVVRRDAALVFTQILLTSAKPPSSAEAKAPPKGIAESFAVPQLGMWPSISLEPGSEVRRRRGGRWRRGERKRKGKEREGERGKGRRRYRLFSS